MQWTLRGIDGAMRVPFVGGYTIALCVNWKVSRIHFISLSITQVWALWDGQSMIFSPKRKWMQSAFQTPHLFHASRVMHRYPRMIFFATNVQKFTGILPSRTKESLWPMRCVLRRDRLRETHYYSEYLNTRKPSVTHFHRLHTNV